MGSSPGLQAAAPVLRLAAQSRLERSMEAANLLSANLLSANLLSERVGNRAAAHHGLRRIGSPDMVVFGGGLPDPAVHPASDIARLIGEVVQRESHVLGYGYEAGDMRLREIVAQGHGLSPEQVMLTNGSAGGIALAASA